MDEQQDQESPWRRAGVPGGSPGSSGVPGGGSGQNPWLQVGGPWPGEQQSSEDSFSPGQPVAGPAAGQAAGNPPGYALPPFGSGNQGAAYGAPGPVVAPGGYGVADPGGTPSAPGPLPVAAGGSFGPGPVRRALIPALLGVAAVVLALAVGLGVVRLLDGGEDTVPPVDVPSSGSTVPAPDGTGSETAEPTPPTEPDDPRSTPPAVDRQLAARQRLDELAAAGLPQVTFDGRLAVRMASKSNGIRDPLQTNGRGTHTFLYADILAEHEQLAAGDNLGATVVLLRSTDYGSRRTSPDGLPLYVTLALDDFDSTAEVATWCRQRFPDLTVRQRENTCMATRLRP